MILTPDQCAATFNDRCRAVHKSSGICRNHSKGTMLEAVVICMVRSRPHLVSSAVDRPVPGSYDLGMKSALLVLVLALTSSVFGQTLSSSCADRSELQGEISDTRALVARMQSRIITIRTEVGTIREVEVRNAMQVNADAWQDLLDSLKKRIDRLQSIADRCEAREKIQNGKPQ